LPFGSRGAGVFGAAEGCSGVEDVVAGRQPRASSARFARVMKLAHAAGRDLAHKCPLRAISLTDLVRQSLRMRPDRLVVGEVRGAEICDLLTAMNTGHEGRLWHGPRQFHR
jgi:hypothetical protein